MRFIGLLPGGLLSMVAVLASCGGTDAGSIDPGPDGSVAPDRPPAEVCAEACYLANARCGNETDCTTLCEEEYRQAGPVCADEYAARYACELSTVQAQAAANIPPKCPATKQCPGYELYICVETYGCVPGFWGYVCDGDSAACICKQTCVQKHYRTECTSDGTASTCDCYVEDVLAGTCAGGPEAFCDENLMMSCCNEYFMLTF